MAIGGSEINFNLNSRLKYIVVIGNNHLTCGKNKTFDIEIGPDWNEFSRVPTPSFHLNTERMLESTHISNNTSSFFPGEISFSENPKSWQDLYKEIDTIIHKQFSVLESPSLGKIKEVCDGITSEYSKIFQKISSFIPTDISSALEKVHKGFLNFFDSCLISLLKYISQLQDKISLSKDTEQKYVVRIASLTKLLQKFSETPNRKKPFNKN